MAVQGAFFQVDLPDVVNGLVALAALVAAFVSLRIAERAGRNDVLSQVRQWGNAVVDRTAALVGLCHLDPQRFGEHAFFTRRVDLVSELSSLWDQGRFFFPNTYRRHYGTDKTEAFRGLRPPILDLLALLHGVAISVDYETGVGNDRRILAATRLKRVFVSAIQRATNFSSPGTMKAYERFLAGIQVEKLPGEIRHLANMSERSFELEFDDQMSL